MRLPHRSAWSLPEWYSQYLIFPLFLTSCFENFDTSVDCNWYIIYTYNNLKRRFLTTFVIILKEAREDTEQDNEKGWPIRTQNPFVMLVRLSRLRTAVWKKINFGPACAQVLVGLRDVGWHLHIPVLLQGSIVLWAQQKRGDPFQTMSNCTLHKKYRGTFVNCFQ